MVFMTKPLTSQGVIELETGSGLISSRLTEDAIEVGLKFKSPKGREVYV